MLNDLSSKDAGIREQALLDIESAAILSDAELERLFVELTTINTWDELALSYQALALSILVRIDAAGQHVLRFDGDAQRRLKPILNWWDRLDSNKIQRGERTAAGWTASATALNWRVQSDSTEPRRQRSSPSSPPGRPLCVRLT